MTRQIRNGKHPGREVHRILRLETNKALWHLDRFEQDPATHVHKARRSFRRIRALLRLVRPAYPYAYAVENRFFRELSRSLSAARDQDAALEIARDLQNNLASGPVGEPAFLLHRLIQESTRLNGPVDPVELRKRVYQVTEELSSAQRRYRQLKFQLLTRKHLRQAMERTMRQLRQSYRRAAGSEIAEDFHELRKHARYALIQTVMCRDIEPSCTPELGARLQSLADVLGTHQDLCVVQAMVPECHDMLGIDDAVKSLIALIELRKRELCDRALVLAQGMLEVSEQVEAPVNEGEDARRLA